MNLTENPTIIQWPQTHYVFIEKIGPFQETAMKAWEDLHKLIPHLREHNKVTGMMSLYKFEPQMTYRAGANLAEAPKNLPQGLTYINFTGGKYAKFTLAGSYMNLPEACGRAFAIVEQKKMALGDHFHVEHYLNDPQTTPEEKLITEILIAVK